MKICAAQVRPMPGDVNSNLALHRRCIEQAAGHGAALIVFPELSLTGYEPKLAKELATTQDDSRLDELQLLSNRHNMVICAGMPTTTDTGIHISMIIFQTDAPRQTYAKQQLHSDELPYFVRGSQQLILDIGGTKVAPAICYESLQANHAANAAAQGAGIYLVSVAKSASGVEKAYKHYPAIAQRHNMAVIMANYVGSCDDFESVGQSAAWGATGELLKQLDDASEGLLIVHIP